MTPTRRLLLSSLVLASSLLMGAPAIAQEKSQPREGANQERPLSELEKRLDRFSKQWRAEFGIERSLALGQIRGMAGKQPPAPDWTPRVAGKGRLERGPGGVPILYLNGTPEEMGAQHGTLLKNEISALRSYVRAFVGPRRIKQSTKDAAALFSEHLPQRYLREAAALAKAVEMPLDELLFAQWFTDLYRSFACSAISAPQGKNTGPFLARNLDFPTLGYLQRYSIVVVARPAGQEPFVAIGWPGLLGVLSGQNKGVALGVLVVHDSRGARSGLPFQFALRRALEETTTSEGVEKLLRQTPLTVTNNLALVDRSGDARVLELDPTGIGSRRCEGRPLTVTNHFESPDRRAPRLSFSYLSSTSRLRKIRRRCPSSEARPSLAQARKGLAEAGVSFTAQSMIFLPKTGELEVAFTTRGSAAKGTFVRIGRELLLGKE